MKTIIVKTLAVLLMILGLIHDIATFTPLILNGIESTRVNSMMYMSLMCGTSLIFSGALLLMLLPKVNEEKAFLAPLKLIGIFLAFAGILAVYFMSYNPFAWITLVLCLLICACIYNVSRHN